VQASHQVDARSHHRCRRDQSADGLGPSIASREPDVQWKLAALPTAAKQQQTRDGRVGDCPFAIARCEEDRPELKVLPNCDQSIMIAENEPGIASRVT